MKVVGMNFMRSRRRTLALVVVLGLMSPALADAQLLVHLDGPAAELASEVVPAAGRHAVVVTIHRFGRYTIAAASEQGVALQLVGRMTGPGAIDGEPGVEDGRLDVFLDVGEYLVRTIGDDRAVGEAQLRVHPLEEANPVPAPQLVELKPIATELADGVQRSYWLEVASRDWVCLEAGGRALADLRLWQDGSWLVDAEPEVAIVDPVVGKPLKVCRIATQLEPGLYLVTASGGAPQPWAEDDGTFPLHLRLGIPRLGTADRRRYEVGPLGIDRWRVPGVASYLRLELPEAVPAGLRAGRWDDRRPFDPPDSEATIVKQSRVPVAELRLASHSDDNIVTVSAGAGQPYILQHFRPDRSVRLPEPGEYWVSSIHSGDPTDSVEATGILVDWNWSSHLQPLRTQVETLSSDRGWTARCNLLEPLSVFFEVKDGGRYVIDSRGTEARFRFQPFMVSKPRGYEAPPFAAAGEPWDLDPGFWVLEAEPVKQGILEVAIRPDGMFSGILDAVGLGPDLEQRPVRGSVRFGPVSLYSRHGYTLFLNAQPGVVAGPVVRPTPLNLFSDPLPLTLQAGESVVVPIIAGEPSRLEAVAEDGSLLDVAVDGGRRLPSQEIAAGHHSVVVYHNGEGTAVCSLGSVPVRLLAETPLPPVPAATLAGLPDFPVLEAERPQPFELTTGQRATYKVEAPADALYRLETTGLLDTEGRLRSRVVTSLAQAASGGTGRNFLLHQYLASGDYQVTVTPRGRSAGHLALGLRRTEPRDGGELRDGLPARTTLAAGESIRYRFTVTDEATYRLRSVALGSTPVCRFETGDGWPVVPPGGAADIEQVLEPGDYALTLLPSPVTGRRVTLFERIVERVERRGHGPHELPLDELVHHVWTEPADDGERLPDVWTFRLEARVGCTIDLDPAMEGRLLRVDGELPSEVARFSGRDGWRNQLERGDYRLEVVRSRPDNRAEYSLAVRPAALLPGMVREINLPAEIDVALPDDLVEITTFGAVDVAARLLDVDGRMVAHSDDRPDDWNVLLSGRLPMGVSKLELQPVGSAGGRTAVRIARRAERPGSSLALPDRRELTLADDVMLLPLAARDRAGMVVASVATGGAVGVALEARAPTGEWRVLGQRIATGIRLEAPVAAADELRLRLWAVNRRGTTATLTTGFATPRRISERQLRHGLRLSAADGLEVAALELDLDSPGVLHLLSSPGELRFSALEGRVLEAIAGDAVAVPAGRSWLALEPTPGGELRAERLVLDDGATARLPLAPGQPADLDLQTSPGKLAMVIARAMTGQPVASFPSGPERGRRYRATVMASHASLAVARSASAVRLEMAGDGWLPEDVRATLRLVEPRSTGPLGWGVVDGSVAEAAAWTLPSATGELRLTLGRGLVAVVLDGDDVASVHWGGDAPLAERTVVDGRARLVVASLDGRPGSYRLELVPGGDELRVGPGRPFRLEPAAVGRIALDVDGSEVDGQVLVTDGADAATYLGDDGHVARGPMIATRGYPGRLVLEHGAAPVTVWFGPIETPALGLWDGIERPSPDTVTMPWRGEVTGGLRSLALELNDTRLVRVTTAGQAALRVCTADGCRAWTATSDQTRHLALGPGRVTLDVQASPMAVLELGVGDLSTVGEGLGYERLVAAGEAVGFRFRVAEAGPVGVGVRADPDTVGCALLTADGGVLGEGVVQMHDLEAGDYLLVVSQPAAAGVSRIQPAVVGIERPPTGPPDDVVRSYLDLERRAP